MLHYHSVALNSGAVSNAILNRATCNIEISKSNQMWQYQKVQHQIVRNHTG